MFLLELEYVVVEELLQALVRVVRVCVHFKDLETGDIEDIDEGQLEEG